MTRRKPPRPARTIAPRKPQQSARRRMRAGAEVAIDPRAGGLMVRCENLLTRLGCARTAVFVDITHDGALLAGAQGFNVNGWAFGRVILDESLLHLLPDDELEFVLAHEVSHIFRNHLVATISTAVMRTMIEREAREDPDLKMLLTVWDVWRFLQALDGALSPAAAMTRANEIEADALAVWLTRDKKAAQRALLRLVGNDLDAPSHTWEVFGATMPVPALSMRDRIDALERLTP